MAGEYTNRFCEQWELVDVVYGDAVAVNTETNSGYNSCAGYHRIAIIIHPVDVNDALDVDIEQGTTTAGAGAKTVGAAGHDITVATTDTAPSIIELCMDELDVDGGFDCVNVEITTANTGGGANDFACAIYGLPRFLPASTSNWDSITD
ncbi:MAG TPA: hypothetical protein VM537_15875 [Anaerolineae bacterium]|nr:hypothetical protein [Anaerolineae bacterium]